MGARLLVVGKINANLADLEGDRRGEDIAAAMATEVLEDMSEQSPMTLIMLPGWEDVE